MNFIKTLSPGQRKAVYIALVTVAVLSGVGTVVAPEEAAQAATVADEITVWLGRLVSIVGAGGGLLAVLNTPKVEADVDTGDAGLGE